MRVAEKGEGDEGGKGVRKKRKEGVSETAERGRTISLR